MQGKRTAHAPLVPDRAVRRRRTVTPSRHAAALCCLPPVTSRHLPSPPVTSHQRRRPSIVPRIYVASRRLTASVTGFSAAQLGLSEIGVSFPDASFGPERYLAKGYPFGYLIRDILQFDTSLAEATRRITEATRTCDLILGVGDGHANDFSGFQYSPHVANVIKPTNLLPANDTWHAPIRDVVYWGMDWVCPNDNKMLGDALRRLHGNITAEATIRDVTSYVSTGNLHIAVYDHSAMHMYVATARPDGRTGPLYAYQRQFVRLDMRSLFGELPPAGL